MFTVELAICCREMKIASLVPMQDPPPKSTASDNSWDEGLGTRLEKS